MNHRTRHRLTTLLLVSLILSGPVVVAGYLIKTATTVPEFSLVAAAPPGGASADPTAPRNSLVTGVLYAAGKARINWSGTDIPVENSRYVYLGGEMIDVPNGSLGILRLAGGSTVFICPGSKVRLSRDPAGRLSLDVFEGSSRFMFNKDTQFRVRVNETILEPGGLGEPGPSAAGEPDLTYVGEVKANEDRGCLLCQLRRNLKVTTPDEAVDQGFNVAEAGSVVNVAPVAEPLQGGTRAVSRRRLPEDLGGAAPADPVAGARPPLAPGLDRLNQASLPIPREVMQGMPAGYPGNSAQAAATYLCRCDKLRELVERPPTRVAEAVEPEPEVAEALASAIAEPPPELAEIAPLPAELAPPPLAPPEISPLALAPPGAPTPDFGFDPNLLDPAAFGDTPLVVPPPAVPTSGGGGGGMVRSTVSDS